MYKINVNKMSDINIFFTNIWKYAAAGSVRWLRLGYNLTSQSEQNDLASIRA